MQFAKDSFYITLHERLAALNPGRVAIVNGVSRTAVLVAENEAITSSAPIANAFYLQWKPPRPVDNLAANVPLLAMDCCVSFVAEGSTQTGVDRGRVLALLSTELLSIASPPHARKRDFTQSPSADLGTDIFWTAPRFEDAEQKRAANSPYTSARLTRTATLTVYFFPELEPS